MDAALSIALGYFVGSLSPSSLVGRVKKTDVRKSGTGNLGATNTMLVLGWGAALPCNFLIGHIGRDKVRRQSSLHANIYFRSVCCYGDLLRENIYNTDLLFRSNFVGCFNGDRCAPGFYAGNTNDGVPVFVKQHIGDLGIAGCDVQTSAGGVVRRDGEGHFKKAADSNRNLFIGNRDALNLDLRNTYDPRHYLYTAFCQKGIQIVSSNSGRPWFQSSKRIGPGLLKRINRPLGP